jgi:sporulation protein YlmC with PRC-barrel domain
MRRQIMRLAGAFVLIAAPLSSHALAQATSSSNPVTNFIAQQPANEWLTRVFIGQLVHNTAGEIVGNVNDLVFDRQGRISTVVLGVGGFLGIGEKSVGIPFSALSINVSKNGERVVVVSLSKQDLAQAPGFRAADKSTLDKVKDAAVDLGSKAAEKAVELKDQAAQKIGDLRKAEPAKQ